MQALTRDELRGLAALETTPEPWVAHHGGAGRVSAKGGERTVLGVSCDGDGEGFVACSVPDLELMAAAPNLLATSLDLQARLASHEEDARRRVDALAAAERALDEARAEVDRLRHMLAVDTPWPVWDVLSRLANAADHLLADHSCDRHGYEEVSAARDAARGIVMRLTTDLGAQTGSIDERAQWCQDHLVHVDAVGVMAAGLAATESAGDAAHAILLDAVGRLAAGSPHSGDVVGLATIAAQEIASAWEAVGAPPAGTLASAIRRIREGGYSMGLMPAITAALPVNRDAEQRAEAWIRANHAPAVSRRMISPEEHVRAAAERDKARAELARASHILAVERGDASRAPPGWHLDGATWWRNDEPRRPIVLVRRRAGERRPASAWYRPGIDGDADGPEFATALEAMEAEDAAQGDP